VKALRAPFPYFGGKRTVAHHVWAGLGDVAHYVEPFFGSGAVLLNRPHAPNCETVNDADGLLANFWRAVQRDPDAVARHADNPVNECDLHARHLWLVNRREGITARLMGEPDWFDARAAGWWAWGASCWIGSGWCDGSGPWVAVDGAFTDSREAGNTGRGVNRQLPHLGGTGRGVNTGAALGAWFADLSDRLRNVRVACGDWSRVCGPSVRRSAGGICGIFFDPPYDLEMRAAVYANESPCAKDVLEWCAAHGNETDLRIVLAGYDGEHNALEAMGWRVMAWKAAGGYGSQRTGGGAENAAKERLWFSPLCVEQPPAQMVLF
jgi:DNA adenine methylase